MLKDKEVVEGDLKERNWELKENKWRNMKLFKYEVIIYELGVKN